MAGNIQSCLQSPFKESYMYLSKMLRTNFEMTSGINQFQNVQQKNLRSNYTKNVNLNVVS